MAPKTALVIAIFAILSLLPSTSGILPEPEITLPPPPPPPPSLPPPELELPQPSFPPPPITGTCPMNTLRLRVCTRLLGHIGLIIGPQDQQCCSILGGLIAVDAAACLCTALKLNVLGLINVHIPIDVSAVLNTCGMTMPAGHRCA